MWNQSQTSVLPSGAIARPACGRRSSGTWPSACHSNITSPVRTSISWIDAVLDARRSAGPPYRLRFHQTGSYTVISAMPPGSRSKSWRSIERPLPGGDLRDRLVARVVDHAGADAVSEHDPPLPVGQHGLARGTAGRAGPRPASPVGSGENQTSWPAGLTIIGPACDAAVGGRQEDVAERRVGGGRGRSPRRRRVDASAARGSSRRVPARSRPMSAGGGVRRAGGIA